MSGVTLRGLVPLVPLGIVVLTALLLIMYEVFTVQKDRVFCAHLALVGAGAALAFSIGALDEPPQSLFGAPGRVAPLVVDAFASFASVVMLAGSMIVFLLSPGYAKNAGHDHGEYYALLLFAVAGMMVMAMSADLMTFFVGLETMSIAVYALCAARTNDGRAAEAALKYFLMGSFATGFLLFGIALVYGATGSVALVDLARAVGAQDALANHPLLGLGLVLIIVGFGFKVSAVPFHMWAPDVYEGAPTPVTGFMAVSVKAAAFVGLLRVVIVGLGDSGSVDNPVWMPILSVLAVATVLGGNMLALVQTNLKRMLAYSSVSHAGYALIGVVAAGRGESSAGAAVLFYLTGYTFMTLGAFGVLAFLERKEGGMEAERFGAYAGIGYKHPALGLAMTLFMVALAGIPPTAGFFGKLYLFSSAIRAGETPLAIVGILGSVISVYYYLRVIVAFYMRDVPDPGPTPTATRTPQLAIGLVLAVVMVLMIGVFPSQWIELGRSAIQSLLVG
ncbi:NADH-quinone oxidoreductase subunit N [Myxococcota bacterium]|nr:NADH-quinone oxidoreductase subunit N [Myxococcota bacterium]